MSRCTGLKYYSDVDVSKCCDIILYSRAGQSVYIGAHNRTFCEEPCTRVTVTRVWEHRDYNDSTYNNDVAIVRYVSASVRN